jgi:hypothetical protein
MKKLALVLSLPALCLPLTAYAHFNLTAPPPSTTTTDGGMGSPPCGIGTASGIVTAAQGGHPLTIEIDEFVPHTGFYRIALAMSSPTELPLDPVVKNAAGDILPPSGKPAGTSSTAAYQDPPVFPVLQDHLFVHTDTAAQMFQMDITLPNVSCDKCTLQVLEFMADHGFNAPAAGDTGAGGGYFYRHCADLKITADPSLPAFGAAGAGGAPAGGGTSTAGGGSGGAPSSGGGAGGIAAVVGGGAPGAGGASAAGATAGGSAVTNSAGSDAATSTDNSGCSCSLGRRRAGSVSFASLLGLLVLARWRGRRSRG